MTRPTIEEIVAVYERLGSVAATARELNVARSTLRDRLAAANVSLPAQGFEVANETKTFDKHGELIRQSIRTKAAPGAKHEIPEGHSVKGESALLDPKGNVVLKWVKTREDALGAGLVEAMTSAMEKFTGAAPLVAPPADARDDIHTLYPLADLHMGMYSWAAETGGDYDVEIASKRAKDAYRSLVSLAPRSRSCTLLNLGDFFHANDQKNVTPGHGHQLDVDGRHARVLEAGADLLLEVIGMLLEHHYDVEFVCLAGNHDPTVADALRVAMRLYYRGHGRVTVDGSPAIAWYKRFGTNLIGATHGHTIKQADLPGMMAFDRAVDWGKTKHRQFFTAHIHHERAVEKAGVRVESFQTLASRDAYAAAGGWRSGQSIQAITLHHERGEIARSRVNVNEKV
ncbi:hypothetical protein [Roseococcus sp.]|uniref:hypothetical protein n=1 Tax=Roseococcus sp. TaxID=2109646 RepID=UPI003BAC1F92